MHASRNGATQAAAGSGHKFDYDLVIIGAGVGGHGAALHAVEQVTPKLPLRAKRAELAPSFDLP